MPTVQRTRIYHLIGTPEPPPAGLFLAVNDSGAEAYLSASDSASPEDPLRVDD